MSDGMVTITITYRWTIFGRAAIEAAKMMGRLGFVAGADWVMEKLSHDDVIRRCFRISHTSHNLKE